MSTKIFPYILLIIGCSVAWCIWPDREIKPIDNTKYYQEQRDSLKLVISIQLERIQIDSLRIIESERNRDSLIEYQNRIYSYYEKKLHNISVVSDDSVYSIFTDEIR